jgi:hypothetical protein
METSFWLRSLEDKGACESMERHLRPPGKALSWLTMGYGLMVRAPVGLDCSLLDPFLMKIWSSLLA